MHILYIHQHFAIPMGSTGTRSYEFARRWVKAGHRVTLITGRYDIGGLELGKKLIQKLNIEGIEIIVVGTRYSNRQSYLTRIASFLCFLFLSTYVGLRVDGLHAVYATSTPLTVGFPAMVLKLLRRIPFIFEVRDQWPEIPVQMGVVRNRIIAKILLSIEKSIYRQSAAVVALSPGMADGVRSVLGEEKNVVVIPNCSDTEMFRPDIDSAAIRDRYGWVNKLVLLHFGAMGKANGLEFVIGVADRLRSNPDIHFVLVGDGAAKTSLIKKTEQFGLKNIEILDPQPKVGLVKLVAACDVSMVIFADFPILEHNSANKFFDSLSAGKPILLNYSGWQRRILEQNDAGFGCELGNFDEFVDKVLYLDSHRRRLRRMGQNARRLAVEEFDRDKLALQALGVIESR